jgi:hypothetical protein
MATLTSSTTRYLVPHEIVPAHDRRKLAELASDNDVPIGTIPGAPTDLEMDNDPNLLDACGRACGEFEVAMFRGGRYSGADLVLLLGTTPPYPNSRYAVKGLLADTAFWHATKRRWPEATRDQVPGAQEAKETMGLLEAGELVWPLQEAQDAGNVATYRMTDQDYRHLGLSTTAAERAYGRRRGRDRDTL